MPNCTKRTKLFYGSLNGLMSVVQAVFQVSENHHKVYLSASQSSLSPVQLISLRAFKKQQRKFKPVIKIIFQDAWHMDALFYLCSFSDTVENWIINRFWNAWWELQTWNTLAILLLQLFHVVIRYMDRIATDIWIVFNIFINIIKYYIFMSQKAQCAWFFNLI